jgi:hypothetical protein
VKNDKLNRELGDTLRYPTYREGLIPSLTDQNPCAQSRNPMDMIRQG